MECSICLCDDAKFKLKCGHVFHTDCIKNWYTKGENGEKCPMCRKFLNIDLQKKWYEEREEHNEEEIWKNEIESLFVDYELILDDYQSNNNMFNKIRKVILNDLKDDLEHLETLLRKCNDISLFEEIVEDPEVILVMSKELPYIYDFNHKQDIFIADKHYGVLIKKTNPKRTIRNSRYVL